MPNSLQNQRQELAVGQNMKTIQWPSKTRRYLDLKTRPTTHRDLNYQRLPILGHRHIRHSHNIRGVRDIARIGWQPHDAMVADTLRLVEQQRYLNQSFK